MATPLQTVKTQFGNKEDLVRKLLPLVERAEGETDAALEDRLLRVPNGKLLRLWNRETLLREKFGTKEKLVDTIVQLKLGRNDADYTKKALKLSTGRLLMLHRVLRAAK